MAVKDSKARFQVLSFAQVDRLDQMLHEQVNIHGRGNFPTVEITLLELINALKEKLRDCRINVRHVRLNGGAASHVLSSESQGYNDVDIIFGVDLSSEEKSYRVREIVFETLLDFLPTNVNKERISAGTMQDAYADKMVKISNENDRWSLIALANIGGKNIELKFVDRMKRQFEFSVDSFQIILDSLLFFYKLSEVDMSEHFYPTVIGESVFGDFIAALHHLDNKLIATRNPEEIRGGGLLKYCNLLVRQYSPACKSEIQQLEKYMCSRFFIDFTELPQQRQKLESYLNSHFVGDEVAKYEYLITLRKVIDNSTVCLMGHERRQTLKLITEIAQQVQQNLAFHRHGGGSGQVYLHQLLYSNFIHAPQYIPYDFKAVSHPHGYIQNWPQSHHYNQNFHKSWKGHNTRWTPSPPNHWYAY